MAKEEKKTMVLVGDTYIGKSCLLGVFANKEYIGWNVGTYGIDFKMANVDHPTKAEEQLKLLM